MKSAIPVMQSRPLLCALLLLFAPFAGATTLATVNGNAITSSDLDRALQEFAASRGADPQLLRQSPQFSQLQQALLRELVERELLWQAASKEHKADESQVAEALARVEAQLGGDERFQRALQAQGLSEQVIRDRLQRELSIQAYVQQEIYAGLSVSDADIRKYYDANRQQFRSPDLLHLRDILIADKPDTDAKASAAQISEKLAEGAKFTDMAHKHSSDISARNGGDLGFLNADDLGPELAPIAAALAEGSTSAPHAGPGGVHLLQLVARRPGIQASLDDVHDLIHEQLLDARRNQALQARVQQLRAEAKITLAK